MAGLLRLGRRACPPLRQSARAWLSSASSGRSQAVGYQQLEQPFPGWRVLEERRVAEFEMDATLLVHERTKAKYLHMACDDSNNAFSVNFRTTPQDSTGVAHILEHTALCGSARFPVRDPFMKMLNRSLSTFMNAMTGPDYTLYPFSTCNQQDYYNLMSVYLDSAFRPLLRELDFLQEGWRLEPEEQGDPHSPLIVKGVVFNEMKGAYANPQSMFGQQLMNGLCPSHTYSHSSGGFPLAIPGLSWAGLKEFHAAHYHPSNCRFFSYGDFPLSETLAKIDTEYLAQFEFLAQDTSVPEEPRWSEPRRVATTCGPDPMNPDPDKQATVAVSYLLSDITDLNSSFALQVLAELLMGGPASPFYKALIESGLGSNFSPVSGFEDHIKETNLTIGLQNVAEEDIEKILTTIDETLHAVVEEGFEAEQVEAVLHSYELGLKHKSANFGMNLIMSMTPFWNHAERPMDYLQVNERMDWFRGALAAEPGLLQRLVRERLLANPHKLVQTMVPDLEHSDREQEQFRLLEQGLRAGLTDVEDAAIRQKCVELAQLQDVQEDMSCLPSLRVADIPLHLPATELQHFALAGQVPVQVAVQPTNGVSYFRALLDTSAVPADLQPLLPVFASVLTKLGAAHLDFRALDTAAELRTGGLAASMHVQEDKDDLAKVTQALLLSSHCLDKNIEPMFELWQHVLCATHWQDTARLATLLKMQATGAANGLAQSGHKYAMSAAASSLSPAAALSEQFGGMTHLRHLTKLSQGEAVGLARQLARIAELVLGRESMRLALNTGRPEELTRAAEGLLGTLGAEGCRPFGTEVLGFQQPETVSQHYVTPFPINFTSLSVPTVPYSSPDHAPLKVLSALLSSKFLHAEIREKGGAYGGGASAGSGGSTNCCGRYPPSQEHSPTTATGTLIIWRRSLFTTGLMAPVDAALATFSACDHH
jgi:Zn-dependent M16 (insulinase) family peptidase